MIEGQVATGATAFFPGAPAAPAASPSDVPPADASADAPGYNGDEDTQGDEGDELDEEQDEVIFLCSCSFFLSLTYPQAPASVAPKTPARRPLAPTSSANSVEASSRKRKPAESDSNDRPTKRDYGRKPTQMYAGFEMAEAVRDLARSAMGDTNVSALSPARKSRAIARLEEDGELSDDEMNEAFKLIRRETSVADTYLAIGKVDRRTRFIQSELASFNGDFSL